MEVGWLWWLVHEWQCMVEVRRGLVGAGWMVVVMVEVTIGGSRHRVDAEELQRRYNRSCREAGARGAGKNGGRGAWRRRCSKRCKGPRYSKRCREDAARMQHEAQRGCSRRRRQDAGRGAGKMQQGRDRGWCADSFCSSDCEVLLP